MARNANQPGNFMTGAMQGFSFVEGIGRRNRMDERQETKDRRNKKLYDDEMSLRKIKGRESVLKWWDGMSSEEKWAYKSMIDANPDKYEFLFNKELQVEHKEAIGYIKEYVEKAETNPEGLKQAIKGANILWEKEINTGTDDHGNVAKKKEIISAVLGPSGKTVMFKLRITRQDGSTYEAPVTIERNGATGSIVKPIPIEDILSDITKREHLMEANFDAELISLGDYSAEKEEKASKALKGEQDFEMKKMATDYAYKSKLAKEKAGREGQKNRYTHYGNEKTGFFIYDKTTGEIKTKKKDGKGSTYTGEMPKYMHDVFAAGSVFNEATGMYEKQLDAERMTNFTGYLSALGIDKFETVEARDALTKFIQVEKAVADIADKTPEQIATIQRHYPKAGHMINAAMSDEQKKEQGVHATRQTDMGKYLSTATDAQVKTAWKQLLARPGLSDKKKKEFVSALTLDQRKALMLEEAEETPSVFKDGAKKGAKAKVTGTPDPSASTASLPVKEHNAPSTAAKESLEGVNLATPKKKPEERKPTPAEKAVTKRIAELSEIKAAGGDITSEIARLMKSLEKQGVKKSIIDKLVKAMMTPDEAAAAER